MHRFRLYDGSHGPGSNKENDHMTKQTQPRRDSSARLRRINIVVVASMLVLVGCARSDEPSPPPPNPAELMTQIQPSSAAKEATTTLTQGANHSAAAPNR